MPPFFIWVQTIRMPYQIFYYSICKGNLKNDNWGYGLPTFISHRSSAVWHELAFNGTRVNRNAGQEAVRRNHELISCTTARGGLMNCQPPMVAVPFQRTLTRTDGGYPTAKSAFTRSIFLSKPSITPWISDSFNPSDRATRWSSE